MLLATPELARRVDRAEIDFCARAARVGLPGGADSLEVGGGVALCGLAGAPYNKVLGLGLGSAVTDTDLDRLDAFYSAHGEPAQVELCPLAVSGVASRLLERGYTIRGFENQLVRPAPFDSLPPETAARVRLASHDDAALWLRIMSRGFAAGEGAAVEPSAVESDRAADALSTVMDHFVHPDMNQYLADLDGEPAGAALSYVQGGVLGIGGVATLPECRRRGVQHGLVARAMSDASGRADLAMATVEPGSTSQRAFERLGFQVVYTRVVFVRPCTGVS